MMRLRRRPLRVKITVLLVVLLSGGLVLSGLIATTALTDFYLQRVDESMMGSHALFGGPQPLPPVEPVGSDGFRPPSRFYIELVYLDGRAPVVIATPDNASGATPAVPDAAGLARLVDAPFTAGSVGGGEQWRVVASASANGYVVFATSLADLKATMDRLVLLQLIVGAIVVVATASIGYVVVRRSLKPLSDMSDVAHEIAAGDLSRRVPERATSTEVDQLAGSFNVMVTRIEESFAAQTESERQARESEERMRQFVADASHELRTPLTTIRGFAELADEGATEPTTALARIDVESRRMGVLVNDLLMLARLDEQRPIEALPVNVLDVVTAAVTGMQAMAPERPVVVVVEGDGPAPVVLGDQQQIRQVLDNLLVNALRHTPSTAEVRVVVGAEMRADRDFVRIDVCDTGPGMPPEVAERAFDRFYQADPARTRSTGNSGLGLSIAQAIVDAHGGEITLETAVDTGTTFTVLLPRA
jgi:two-component system OmpR family sensor kinase